VHTNHQVRRTSFPAVILVILAALLIGGCSDSEAPPNAVPTIIAPTILPPTPPNEAASREIESPVATAVAVENASAAASPANSASYPAPLNATAAESYPAPVTLTPETSRIPIVPFVLDRPLESGAEVLRGSGPANVPIVIADLFLMGEVIGSGVIGADGRFEITVPPLEKGHWIGIALDNLSGTEFAYEDFYPQGFRGVGAEQIPQVGFAYDSDYVQ